jgi:hypothetical protein
LIQPSAQFAEPMRVDKINPARSFRTVGHKTRLLQRFEMLRYSRPTDRQTARDLADGSRSLFEALKHPSPGRIG